MNEIRVAVATLFVLSSLFPWTLFRLVWTNRSKPGATGLLVIIPSVSLYAFVSAMITLTTVPWLWFVVSNILVLSIASVTVGWLLTTAEHAGYINHPLRWLNGLGAVLLGEQLLAWTNGIHTSFYDPVGTVSLPARVAPNAGPLFMFHTVLVYLLLGLGVLICVVNAFDIHGIRRKQTLALLAGVFPPAGVNILWLAGLTPYNLTALGFVLSVFVLAWALFKADFFAVVPNGRKRAVRNIPDPMVVIDAGGKVVDSNPAARELVDAESGWKGVQTAEFFSPFDEQFAQFEDSTPVETDVSVTKDGTERHFDLKVSPLGETANENNGWVVLLRDITQVKEREQRLREFQMKTEEVLNKRERESICEAAIETVEDVLGISEACIHLYNRRQEALVPITASPAFERRFDSEQALDQGPESLLWEVYNEGEIRVLSDTDEIAQPFDDETVSIKSMLLVPLSTHGILSLSAAEPNAFDDRDQYFGQLLSTTVATSLDGTQREQGLEAVQDITRDAVTATTHDEMAESVLGRMPAALDLPLSAIWEYNKATNRLHPVASTGHADPLLDDMPVFKPGNSIAWDSFKQGETKLVSSVSDHPEAYNSETNLGSEILSPIGEFGLFAAGSTQEESFSENERQIIETLTTNLRTASRLTERRRDLRLLDQVLARVLRHNLRNDLTVIQGHAKQIQRNPQGDIEQHINSILHSSKKLAETASNAQVMRTVIKDRENTEQISLQRVIRWAVEEVTDEFPDATVQLQLEADPTVVAHPNIVTAVEQLVRNAVEHGSSSVSVSVYTTAHGPTVEVSDDGPGIPENEIEILEKHGESALEHGTGVGLWIVDRVAEYSNASVDFTVEDGTVVHLTFSNYLG
ncbi:histidine kinase N-terminal 7TM domain-containing protein [Halovenus rubra]|uniref:histidine kinase n=2 Tax=Halovenus rubra TaxID=869890 RepID=A0ABD5XCE9_9EURY|nr:histidine kinase N-terminal 7TM domain-containing protein [Halovenus rubra]